MKIALLTTTGGSLINETLKQPRFKSRIHAVLSDRACGGIQWAEAHGIRTHVIPERDNRAFSDALLTFGRREQIDVFVTASYARLLAGPLLEAYRNRLFNLHGSLLPAFVGIYPIAQTLSADTRYLGNTIHLIDESIDGGAMVLQSIVPRPYDSDHDFLRHRVFEQICKGLIQLVSWLWDQRLDVTENGVRIKDAHFDEPTYSPNLDDEEAIRLSMPYPWWDLPEYTALAARTGKAVKATAG